MHPDTGTKRNGRVERAIPTSTEYECLQAPGRGHRSAGFTWYGRGIKLTLSLGILELNGTRMKREYWLYLLAAGCGAAIWILIALASGRREAWDSSLYFSVGIPAVCLASLAFAFFEPDRSWRWGVLPLVGQFIWMLLSQGPGNLLPLGVIVFAVLSVPSIIAARIGAFIATKTGRTQ
jgi:hypothetical protein